VAMTKHAFDFHLEVYDLKMLHYWMNF